MEVYGVGPRALHILRRYCEILQMVSRARGYYGEPHRFWAGHGMETTTLKVKLLQKVMDIREDVLHAIFLDLHKAYDALDM